MKALLSLAAIAWLLAGCGLARPLRQPPPATASPPAVPTVAATPSPSTAPTPTAAPTAPIPGTAPAPRADPLGALRYALLPGLLHSATFTSSLALTMTLVRTIAPVPTDVAGGEVTTTLEVPMVLLRSEGQGALRAVDLSGGGADLDLEMRSSLTSVEGVVERRIRLVRVGDRLWLSRDEGPWEESGPTLSTLTGQEDPARLLQGLSSAAGAEWLGAGRFGGEPVERLRLTVDARAVPLWPELWLVFGVYPHVEFVEPETTAEVWLSSRDGLPRLARLQAGATVLLQDPAANLTVTTRWAVEETVGLTAVNRPVEIEAPAATAPAPTATQAPSPTATAPPTRPPSIGPLTTPPRTDLPQPCCGL